MKKIPLRGRNDGLFIKVDDEDFPVLSRIKWSLSAGYPSARIAKGCFIYMHRLIQGSLCFNMEVDHKNGDKLDNRKRNLRLCSRQQNQCNVGMIGSNTSGFKGVWRSHDKKKWVARIVRNRKAFHLGTFDTPEEASIAYNRAAKEKFGDFAKLNNKKRYAR